jgi:hypothetical protein
MAKDIQERMCALIAQHGSVLAALTALRQHLEAQRNDEQTNSLENHVPHIDVPIEFNQGTSESARERHNCLKRERHAKQREQPSLRCDALQLFGDEDASTPGRWDCGKMDTICGFCSAKMWIKERSAKSRKNHPQFSLCYENGKVLLPSLPATPQELEVLLTSKESSAVKFRDQIRMYNLVLAFILLGAKVDESVTGGAGPYSFHIQGELYHKIGSLCPVEGQRPQFAQLYIHDTKHERQTAMSLCPRLIQRHWIGC